MCGIVGIVAPQSTTHRTPWTEGLHHRGPDARGDREVALPWGTAHLGTTRLSIVDATGQVPTPGFFAQVGVLLAFNGEVYNWRELRQELTETGTVWETRCDTEVVAHAWRRWGTEMLRHFNGMFSLALVDLRTSVVFLARDRAGEKPLYYASHEGAFFFASEAKALGVPLIEGTCPELDVLEFDCLEGTLFQGVLRLEPGQSLLLQSPSDLLRPQPQTWWTFPTEVDEGMTWKQAADETEALLVDAILLRADTEVLTTVLVSGGLDSAIVQAVARFPQVFCCSFPQDGLDWLPQAQLAARGAEVVPVTFGLPQAMEALGDVAYHLDTPATWTALGQWFLGKEMNTRGYKVVLSGEGADELFLGYSRHRILWWLSQARKDPQLANYQALIGLVTAGTDVDILAKMLDRSPKNRSLAHAQALVRRFSTTGDLAADMGRVEWHTTMQCLLRMADRMMAAHSIENRSPLLDYRLIELAARMPTRHKVTADRSKAVLREVALRVGVHPNIVNDLNKTGFVVPWNQWHATGQTGERGAWDRGHFRAAMHTAWQRTFRVQKQRSPTVSRTAGPPRRSL